MRQLGIVMDPIETINPKKDSTLAMMLEAQKRGWQLWYMTMHDLFLDGGQVMGLMRPIEVYDDSQHWFDYHGPKKVRPITELEVTLMRKDPPFDLHYFYATIFLDLAKSLGHLVINDPQSLRDSNEKLFTGWFPQLCPETRVTSSKELLFDFIAQHNKIILKPLDGMGGRSIFCIQKGDPNTHVILEHLTKQGKVPIMAQAYIEAISQGDKRILMIDGKPFPYALLRIPSKGDFRGNLAAGGQGKGVELSEQDKRICEIVGPVLKQKGLFFAGLDVIGDKLTEINVTSATCIREIDAIFHVNVSETIFNVLEDKLNTKKKDHR